MKYIQVAEIQNSYSAGTEANLTHQLINRVVQVSNFSYSSIYEFYAIRFSVFRKGFKYIRTE